MAKYAVSGLGEPSSCLIWLAKFKALATEKSAGTIK
jgi:hypothetical protein